MKELSPLVWFSERQLKTIPRHFIRGQTPPTPESLQWVLITLHGRYVVTSSMRSINDMFGADQKEYIFFEDPKEAMIYELRWAGEK